MFEGAIIGEGRPPYAAGIDHQWPVRNADISLNVSVAAEREL